MEKALENVQSGTSYLEIGVGNGGNLRAAQKKFHIVTGTDIASVAYAKKSNPSSELVLADRASCFRPSTFDVVAFNPPYLPTNEIVDKTVDGGEGGIEVPIRFLESAIGVMKNSGRVLVLLSSESKLDCFLNYCERHSLAVNKLCENKLFFETLFVFEITKLSRD
jgi:release factor glutamine methyltransferase